MLIEGTISAVTPPDYRDNYGNEYQNITVDTANGPVLGRKGSKTSYAVHDIGKQVKWECETATNARGTYNKFKMPQDPNYAQNQQAYPSQHKTPQPAPPQAPQSSQQPAQQPNAREDCIIRQACLKAVFSAAEIPLDMIGEYLTTAVNYAKTGQWQLSPNALPVDRPVDYVPPTNNPEEEIPF